MTTTVVNSAFGFAFWVMAARLFATDVVGLTAAVMAASTIVALLASLGVGSTLIQSLPEHGLSADWSLTFWAGMATAAVTSLVIGCAVLVVLPLIGGDFSVLHGPLYALAFVVATVATTVGAVFDYVFLAERAAGNMLGRNSVVASGKVIATILLVLIVGNNVLAILGAWALAAVAGVGVGAGLLVRRVDFVRATPAIFPRAKSAWNAFASGGPSAYWDGRCLIAIPATTVGGGAPIHTRERLLLHDLDDGRGLPRHCAGGVPISLC